MAKEVSETLIVLRDGTQMWDVRYKYPYETQYLVKDEATGEMVKKVGRYSATASCKCVASSAEQAIALVKEFDPSFVILGVHLREGGDRHKVLIDPATLPVTTCQPA
jgi:hypothetical protein